ncbi:MAG: hypothetical protein LBJ95_01615 [Oscillospiraceae bacterium]|nr:hypothetical protein [Oscillospiraceae bacterium]
MKSAKRLLPLLLSFSMACAIPSFNSIKAKADTVDLTVPAVTQADTQNDPRILLAFIIGLLFHVLEIR